MGSRNLGPTCFHNPCHRVLSRRPPRLKPLNLNCPCELIASGRAHLISELEGRWLRWCPKSRWSCNLFPSCTAELPAQKFLDLMSIRSAKKCICLLQKKCFAKAISCDNLLQRFISPRERLSRFLMHLVTRVLLAACLLARSERAKVALSHFALPSGIGGAKEGKNSDSQNVSEMNISTFISRSSTTALRSLRPSVPPSPPYVRTSSLEAAIRSTFPSQFIANFFPRAVKKGKEES